MCSNITSLRSLLQKAARLHKFLEFILHEWFVYINTSVVLTNDKCILRYKCTSSGPTLPLAEGTKLYKISLKAQVAKISLHYRKCKEHFAGFKKLGLLRII